MKRIVLACMLTCLSGCVISTSEQTATLSVGQQLLDLKSARDSGALSEKEYADAKSKMLSKNENCEWRKS